MSHTKIRILWHFGTLHSGGGRMVGQDLLAELAEQGSEGEHLCVVDRRLLRGYSGRRPANVIECDQRGRGRKVWVDQVVVPRIAKQTRAAALISLANVGPWIPGVPHGIFVQTPYLAFGVREMRGVRRRALPYAAALRRYFHLSSLSAAGFAVQTEAMRVRLCATWRIPLSRVRVIRGSLPGAMLHALRTAARAPTGDPPVLLTASSDAPHKNLDLIPPTAAELRSRGRRLRFVVTLPADSAGAARLRRLAARFGVSEDIEFAGVLDADGMARELRRAVGAFLPSLLETLGLPYLEASAAGIPVAASDRWFAREACGPRAAYFDPLDARSAADAVDTILKAGGHVVLDCPERTPGDVARDFVRWAGELATASAGV